uniref:60S ribosomal protein L22-2 n=1 Tax=Rhizophora mucronata TaxID=61149 RepID=A0A2P2L5B9_RHIMU
MYLISLSLLQSISEFCGFKILSSFSFIEILTSDERRMFASIMSVFFKLSIIVNPYLQKIMGHGSYSCYNDSYACISIFYLMLLCI